jgi:sugar phosphate isomerase/epimerase
LADSAAHSGVAILKDSIHTYFKVGLISFMAFPSMGKGEEPKTADYIRRIARDDYFDAIELTWIKDAEQKKEVKKILDSAHMTVCYGAFPRLLTTGMNANHLDEGERQKAEKTLLEAIDEAAYFGAEGMAFLSGKWEAATKEQSYAQLLKTTRKLCDYAGPKNIRIEVELFDYDIAKASLIGPASLAARFASDMRETYRNFGLVIDLSHIPMCRESPEYVIRTLRPYLTHFHLGNTVCTDPGAPGYGDEHQRFGFPNGSNDTPQVLEYLRALKNEGFFNARDPYILSFEIKPWQDEDPELVIANAKRVLNRAWALLED